MAENKTPWLGNDGYCINPQLLCRHCGKMCQRHSFAGHYCPDLTDPTGAYTTTVFDPQSSVTGRTTSTASNIESTLQERGSRYGSFKEHARITQNIKAAYRDSPNWDKLSPEQKESLEMNAHKVGRILNGDPNYKDSWVDIEGYTHLVSVELKD